MSVNQDVKPITISYGEEVSIGGCNLTDLAAKYGTPLYVIDEKTLRTAASEYIEAFSGIKVLYASKALNNLAVAKILDEEGLGFDVVSLGEMYTLKQAGVNFSKVILNGSNKTEKELEYALQNGVGRISVDNFYEAQKLNEIANKNGFVANVLLRITPGIECHTHNYIQTGQIDSKFGFDLTQVDNVIELINKEYKNLNLVGLHSHIGSQIFELQSFYDEVDILVKEVARIKQAHGIALQELNLGGGLGVKYTEQDNPPSVFEAANTIKNALNKAFEKYSVTIPTIYIEPGRSIISTSGVTLYTIGSTKQIPNGRKYIAVDGGMADNPRPAMYQAEYSMEIVSQKNTSQKEKVTVVGRFCESGDVLKNEIELVSPSAGDILCVYNTGAYNYSMASNYNKTEKPAMVLVNNSQSDIIVYRESLDDLIAKECIPDRLRK